MTGARGPIPKRSDQRRRRNKEGGAISSVPAQVAAVAVMPEPAESWHPMAHDWFVSLGRSGQAVFFQPSDWQQARVAAEILSRMLESRTKSGHPSINGQALSAWLSMTTTLMVTEGDRRRLRVELQRVEVDEDEDASVVALDRYRAALEA
jgi:hypothetical protein